MILGISLGVTLVVIFVLLSILVYFVKRNLDQNQGNPDPHGTGNINANVELEEQQHEPNLQNDTNPSTIQTGASMRIYQNEPDAQLIQQSYLPIDARNQRDRPNLPIQQNEANMHNQQEEPTLYDNDLPSPPKADH